MKDLVKNHGLVARSSNYTLYGDISSRVMKTLATFSPEQEIYSIDESFLSLTGFETASLLSYAQTIRQTVAKNIGIPTCVGLGGTKCLSKIANRLAKKTKHNIDGGVFSLLDDSVRERELASYPVGDVWGIGRQSAAKLNKYGIYTAKELRDADPALVQKLLTIVGAKIQRELKGESCIPLEEIPADRKQIVSSKSFGKPVFDLEQLKEASSVFVTSAALKLREQGSTCFSLTVFVQTNRFKDTTQYYNQANVELDPGTASTSVLAREAHRLLEKIYKDDIEYKKVGVILSDLRKHAQPGLFDDKEAIENDKKIMNVMDKVNALMGRNTMSVASVGFTHDWEANASMKSPNFTTRWADLLKAN